MRTIEWAALFLVILGSLNWGIIAFTEFDVFSYLMGGSDSSVRILYGIIGAASLYTILLSFTKLRNCTFGLVRTSARVDGKDHEKFTGSIN